jgi:hypothetical protein
MIEHDHTFTTECDGPHPAQISVERLSNLFADDAALDRYIRGLGGRIVKGNVRYLCPGCEEHFYSQWVSAVGGGRDAEGRYEQGEWTEWVTDTLTQTLGSLEHDLGVKLVVGRKPLAAVNLEPLS